MKQGFNHMVCLLVSFALVLHILIPHHHKHSTESKSTNLSSHCDGHHHGFHLDHQLDVDHSLIKKMIKEDLIFALECQAKHGNSDLSDRQIIVCLSILSYDFERDTGQNIPNASPLRGPPALV